MAAWTTEALGLSMAFGAFLAGMILADTEFRHQVDATIRQFRDVLVGLFFVSVGMLFDPAVLLEIWPEALAGGAGLLLVIARYDKPYVTYADLAIIARYRIIIIAPHV